jgi:hypothetical protein
LRDPLDVDDEAVTTAAVAHLNQQIRASGERSGVIAVPAKKRHGLVQRLWCGIVDPVHGSRDSRV